jgi:hypothetical protein
MPEMMARVEAEDFDTWLRSHRSQAGQRRGYGMVDGPIYRDVDDPNAAFVHILCRAETRTLALSWCFPRSLGCSPVLADQALDGLPALDPGGHIDRLLGSYSGGRCSRD